MTRSSQLRGARQPAMGWGVWPRPSRSGVRGGGAAYLRPDPRRALLSHSPFPVCHGGVCHWPVQLFPEVGTGMCGGRRGYERSPWVWPLDFKDGGLPRRGSLRLLLSPAGRSLSQGA